MPYTEGRTVGEQQKNSTFNPHMERRTVGRQQKNQHLKTRKVVHEDSLFVYQRRLSVKYDKKMAVKVISEAAKNYKEYLQDRHFLIVYQEKEKVKTVQVEFRDNHFLHLTGVTTKLSAQQFYEKCINSKLSVAEFELDKNGKTQRKLAVLPFLHELLYHNCMIGNFINSGIYIKADYFVGNTKAVLSVGFRYGKKKDFPVTLYKEDIKKLSHPTNKVLAIFSKNYHEYYYTECTYLSKWKKVNELQLSEEIREVIKVEKVDKVSIPLSI